jgi:hypothetical protein
MSLTAPVLRTRVPRLAEAALERARLTVVPRRPRRRTSPVPFLLVVSMLAVGGVVGLLLFNTSMQQASFAATQLQRQADLLQAKQQSLQMQLDQLRDPQDIARRAQRMGMVLPSSPAVLDLRTGKVLGDPAPATRSNLLRLTAPPPAKPAELDTPQVTRTSATGTTSTRQSDDSPGTSTRGARHGDRTRGSNGHTSHTKHSRHAKHIDHSSHGR